MQSELEFATTAELIEELLSRHTFLGVVIQSDEEHKSKDWQEQKLFKVHFNDNLTSGEASRLLDAVAEHMDLHC